MSDWTRMTNPAAVGEPTFVATYERPKLVRTSIMSCGHPASAQLSTGGCMACQVEDYFVRQQKARLP